MSYRVDGCRISLLLHIPFAGSTLIDFSLPTPIDADDPLVVMILERNRQITEAQIRAEGPAANLSGFG